MDFNDHLTSFIESRESNQPEQQVKTQNRARESLAKRQEEDHERAGIETKLEHVSVNGRWMLKKEQELAEITSKLAKTRPADPERVAYLQKLRKQLKLTALNHENANSNY
ncbi:hypothetical protein [Photobacterium leiognathi]|uniref:hypothetical protein n=1 Tax=Photobacterium leiognathi TaxID=553611 RepID=UPI0029813963|nr:hypothetical protein [Photobacterium leiognathi]